MKADLRIFIKHFCGSVSGAAPSGTGGGKHWGGAGAFLGQQTRLFLFRRSGGVGGKDACKLARALRE